MKSPFLFLVRKNVLTQLNPTHMIGLRISQPDSSTPLFQIEKEITLNKKLHKHPSTFHSLTFINKHIIVIYSLSFHYFIIPPPNIHSGKHKYFPSS